MELIVSISNWSYFFINIIEIHFLSFFLKKKVLRKCDVKSLQFVEFNFDFFSLISQEFFTKNSRIFIFKCWRRFVLIQLKLQFISWYVKWREFLKEA